MAMTAANWPIAPRIPPRSDFLSAMCCLRPETVSDVISRRRNCDPHLQSCVHAPLQRKPAIPQVNLPGRVARLVGGEINRKCRDLLRGAEPAHRLPVDEVLPHRLLGPAG